MRGELSSLDVAVINWAAYVSTCKLCHWAVLKHHGWHWSDAPTGIVHDVCPAPSLPPLVNKARETA